MIRISLIISFCILALSSFAQTEEPGRILIEGTITDTSMAPVSYANILIKSRNEGTISDYYGKFRISVLPGDTLTISAISFQRLVYIIPYNAALINHHIDARMQPSIVELKELIVRPWPATYEQFKKEFVEMKVEDPLANLDLHLPSPEEMRMLSYSLEGGFGIRLPLISIIYDKFSKEARSKRNYDEVMKQEKAFVRYNRTVVSKITGLKNEDEITKFMEFCALQTRFILESTDYEIYASIMNCYDEFSKTNADTIVPGE